MELRTSVGVGLVGVWVGWYWVAGWREEQLISRRGVEMVVVAAGFSPVPLPFSPPFHFLPKLQHLEENDYWSQAAKTTYQQSHTLKESGR